MAPPPEWLQTLVSRYDAGIFAEPGRRARVGLEVSGEGTWEIALVDGSASLVPSVGRPDALIAANARTWDAIATRAGAAMSAYLAGKLSVRRNLHVGVGFLAATSGSTDPGCLRFRYVATRRGRLSIIEAGEGPAVLAVHGLGGTKGSMLPTVAALSDRFRVIALDLPGFGDSMKPIGVPYDPRFFVSACIQLLDALELERAHLIGNSLGGRVAIELALSHPERVNRLVLLAPSLAWRRRRLWAPLVRLTRPELGLVQLAPRAVIEGIVRPLIPGADEGWAAAGVDEFLRAYLTPAGRAAFYAAARHIYLEKPHGDDGFWTRLATLDHDALFVWGRRDRLVPIGFERHVAAALPRALHLELDCGHVPQIEQPGRTNKAVAEFLVRVPDAHPRSTTTRSTRPPAAARKAAA